MKMWGWEAESLQCINYEQINANKITINIMNDLLCGLVVRVPGYRSRGPGFYSRRYQIF
jgi:hypothetical protein